MLISIVIPCYRSENTVAEVVEEVKREILSREGNDYQIILVNDCSPDGTFHVIQRLAEEDPNIVGLDLARNYGQNNARLAAVPYIKGDVAICMDDDGQHPADQIYRLVDKINEGYDLVYAHFAKQKQTLFRRMASRVHTRLQEITGAKMKGIFNSPFLAWSRFSIQMLKYYHSPFVSAGAYLMRVTTRVANIEMQQRKRIAGTSNYTVKKLVNLWLTEFTNFSLVPLRLAGIAGAFSAALGVLFGIVLVIRKLLYPSVAAGYTSTIVILLVVGGIIMLMLGLLGEYIGKIYMTISDLPQYIIRSEINGSVADGHQFPDDRTIGEQEAAAGQMDRREVGAR